MTSKVDDELRTKYGVPKLGTSGIDGYVVQRVYGVLPDHGARYLQVSGVYYGKQCFALYRLERTNLSWLRLLHAQVWRLVSFVEANGPLSVPKVTSSGIRLEWG